MTTTFQEVIIPQQPGPIGGIYNSAKTYLAKLPENQIVSTIDSKLTKALETCDKLVLSTSENIRKTVSRIPNPKQLKTYIAESSEKTL